MSFIPGKLVTEFTTKSGKTAVVRYPRWEDLHQMLKHINDMSAEDTYITFSGEVITLEEEAKYLASSFAEMELHKTVKLFCFVEDRLAGVCDISHIPERKKRSAHVGRFGIIIDKEFRGDGIGSQLAQATIDEAKKMITGLELVVLECFSTNEPAMKLYKKLGFVEAGRIPGMTLHKKQYIDEVQMALHV